MSFQALSHDRKLLGERPAVQAWLGAGAGLLAIGLISGSSRGGAAAIQSRALTLALAAGVAFGLFFICLSRAPEIAGFWPLLAARLSSLTVLLAIRLVQGRRWDASRGAIVPAAVSGVLDMTANALFLLALRHGDLALVAVLVSLYPAATVLLAFGLLRERLRVPQCVGVGLAVVAVGLIASG